MENSFKNSFECFESETIKEKIKAQKKFIIKISDKKYRLTIIKYDKCIQIKINNISSLDLYYYQNKYTFQNIIDTLKVDINLYDSFDKIMDLIKDVYINNNISLKFFNNNNNINLIIRYNNYESIFTLNKCDLEINEKIDIVINEINNIRKNKNISLIENKLKQLEKILDDLKKFIYRIQTQSTQYIQLLKCEIYKNIKVLNDNKETIRLLNIELANLNIKFDEFKEKVKNKLNNMVKKEEKEEKEININNIFCSTKDINKDSYNNIQITIFTTNNMDRKPITIFEKFLKKNNHSMVEKTDNKIEFFIQFIESYKSLKINIHSIVDFDAYVEENIIKNVSCYILFIDLDNYDIKEHYKLILEYIKYNCNSKIKLYVLGMLNENEEKKYIYEEDIQKQLYDLEFIYEYININMSDENNILETIMRILFYCSEHPIVSENQIQEKNNTNNYTQNYQKPFDFHGFFQCKTINRLENNNGCIIV